MSSLKITLVLSVKNPSGYIVSGDELSTIAETAELSLKEGLPQLWVVSSDVSLSKARAIASYIADVSGNDVFVAGHQGSEDGNFEVSYGHIESMDMDRLLFLAPFAESSVIHRLFAFCSNKIDESPDNSSHKWFDIIVKVSKETAIDWKESIAQSHSESKAKSGSGLSAGEAQAAKTSLKAELPDYVNDSTIYFDSTALHSARYNVLLERLYIELKSGLKYVYSGVPLEIFSGLLNAKSAGRYFGEYIKKGGFPYQLEGAAKIENVKITSTAIDSISHDEIDLIVTFKSGDVYRYLGCPKKHAYGLMDASSGMGYMREHIINVYKDQKIS